MRRELLKPVRKQHLEQSLPSFAIIGRRVGRISDKAFSKAQLAERLGHFGAGAIRRGNEPEAKPSIVDLLLDDVQGTPPAFRLFPAEPVKAALSLIHDSGFPAYFADKFAILQKAPEFLARG